MMMNLFFRSATLSQQSNSCPAIAKRKSANASIRAKNFRPYLFITVLLPAMFACGNKENNNTSKKDSAATVNNVQSIPQTHPVVGVRTEIGKTGYYIILPATHKSEEQVGEDFLVYYFTPLDTMADRGEAGIYFGANPDMKPPSRAYTKRNFNGKFCGKDVSWTEYTTDAYTQRETFIDVEDGQKIHCWCYSDRLPDLEKLFDVIGTIGK